jgi:hypothetical protein
MGVGSTEAPAPPTTTDNVGGCTDARSGPELEEAAPPVCVTGTRHSDRAVYLKRLCQWKIGPVSQWNPIHDTLAATEGVVLRSLPRAQQDETHAKTKSSRSTRRRGGLGSAWCLLPIEGADAIAIWYSRRLPLLRLTGGCKGQDGTGGRNTTGTCATQEQGVQRRRQRVQR